MKSHSKNSRYLIGVDSGSTGIKAIALQNGQIAFSAHAQMKYHENGMICEYDAETYYEQIADLIRQITGAMPEDSICDGITVVCASGNTLLLKEGKPLLPVFSWRDNRGGDAIEAVLGPLTEEQIHESVGWHKVPKFPLAQLSWIKQNHPDLLENADRICEASCYINYRLCGEWAMDHSTATTFYLQDQEKLCWNAGTLKLLGIPEHKLPRLTDTGSQIGQITESAARDTGLPLGTPVTAGCYDGASAALCAGIFRKDQMLISCGTSWVCIYPSFSRKYLLDLGVMIDPYFTKEHLWIGMTSLGECGVYLNRILNNVLPRSNDPMGEFNRFAAQSVPGAHGLLLNPMRMNQNGCLSEYSVSDICRALMEGIVYSIKRQMQFIQEGHSPLNIAQISMVGGPSSSAIWPQIVSDILERPVHVAFGTNACAVGAAMIAGIGSGIFHGPHDAWAGIKHVIRSYTPDPAAVAVYRKGYEQFIEKFPGLDENMH